MATDLKSSAVITTTALDADGLSTAAAVGNNAALTLGGALTSGGAYTADTGTARQITLLSASDDSGITFTVVGTDVNGDALSETVTGADSSTATSTGYFATISSITAVGNPAGNMSAGINSNVAGVVFKGRTSPMYLLRDGNATDVRGDSYLLAYAFLKMASENKLGQGVKNLSLLHGLLSSSQIAKAEQEVESIRRLIGTKRKLER